MRKINCWEYKKCGRQPGGQREKEFGVCPASLSIESNRINDGVNGGRYCWAVTETLCEFDHNGIFKKNLETCKKVKAEEGPDYTD